jgi:hypothetical protein
VVVLVTRSTTKLDLQFLDLFTILTRIYKVLLKQLRGEETFCTQTPFLILKVHSCARGLPHRTPKVVGTLAGGEVGPGEANKRARSAIGLTRGRLAAEARRVKGPVMAGGEALAAPPRR